MNRSRCCEVGERSRRAKQCNPVAGGGRVEYDSAKAGAVMLPCADRNERRDQVAAIASLPGTYLIPPGGSSARGCLGFVNAAFELKEQIERGELPCPDEIYITFGSSGSVTGLLFGLKLAGLPCHVTASCVVPDAEKTAFSQDIVGLFGKIKKLLRPHLPEVELLEVTVDDVTIDWDHYNEEYARISGEQADAMRLLKLTSGISVDGTYAGKTFTALCDHVKANPALRTKKILFWNTFFSGLPTDVSPEIFSALQKNYATLLPKELYPYFDGSKTISHLDQGF
ncbi:pyridoxal-phosphate dependent enzyme [bacterium]|nr:pyridoxal-phosphate dependent enzyme [bacterium]